MALSFLLYSNWYRDMSCTFSSLIRMPFMQTVLLKYKFQWKIKTFAHQRVFALNWMLKIDLWLAGWMWSPFAGYGFVLCVRIDLTDSFVDCHKRSTHTDGVMCAMHEQPNQSIEAQLPIDGTRMGKKGNNNKIFHMIYLVKRLLRVYVILELIKCLLLSNRFSAFTANCWTLQNAVCLLWTRTMCDRHSIKCVAQKL